MKRTTAATASEVQDHKISVSKFPISKPPLETRVLRHSDPAPLSGPREDEPRRKAPEMKFLYLISACLTLMVLWGIFREAKFRLPGIGYGSGAGAGEIVDGDASERVQVNAKSEVVKDLINNPGAQKDLKHFLEKYPYSFGTPVTDWDQQRQIYRKAQPVSAAGRKQPIVFLVSGSQPESCVNPVGDHYLLKFLKNRVDYCRLHGIRHHFYNMADIDEGVHRFWVKLPLLRTLMLEHPDAEWIWWVDSDALFTNMTYEIPFMKYKKYNFIIQGNRDSVYQMKDWKGLNTGVFLIRNCQWSLDFLQAWARMADKEFEDKWGQFLSEHLSGRERDLPAEDQSAAVYLLSRERTALSSKVLMEDADHVAQHWKVAQRKLEGTNDDKRPFVTHFAGCQPCSGTPQGATVAECKDAMERAFNFADNQVLEALGFQHPDLSSHFVKPMESWSKKDTKDTQG